MLFQSRLTLKNSSAHFEAEPQNTKHNRSITEKLKTKTQLKTLLTTIELINNSYNLQ